MDQAHRHVEKINKVKRGVYMITVYKIGKSMYKTKRGKIIDKNSGYYEYMYITKECATIETDKNVLIIINGKFGLGEKEALIKCMKTYDKCIFIASDIIALTDNVDIINKCNYLLHQCPSHIFAEFINIKQYYSFVPELFYKYCKEYAAVKYEYMIFGGGVRDNEDKINDYLSNVPCVSFMKTEAIDNRIPYEEYLKELSKSQYALIVSRKAYSAIGWVTARFAEAIAKRCIPIVDIEYDKYDHFKADKVDCGFAAYDLIKMYNKHRHHKEYALSYFTTLLEQRADEFKRLIRGICNE